MTNIEYSPLENAYTAPIATLLAWFNFRRVIILLGIIGCMIWLIFVGLGWIVSILLFGAFAYLLLRALSASQDTWTAFAEANNWTQSQTFINDIPPAIRGIGHNTHLGVAINADIDGKLCRIYKYDYSTGMGDFESLHNFTVMQIELPKVFPHIVLDSQQNEDGVRRLFKKYQKVSLENNFDKYFRLYIQNDEQINALSIITPDVMASLIDGSIKLDIEIFGTSLFFIATDVSQTKAAFQYILESTQPVIDDILHKAKSLNYSPNNVEESLNLSTRPLVPLTITGRTKIFAIIIFLLSVAFFGLIIFFARQTSQVQTELLNKDLQIKR